MGLVSGTSGNASIRLKGRPVGDLVLITPTQRPYSQLAAGDMVAVDLEGQPVEGELAPSSELALHLTLYDARSDVGAVIHTHSPYASVLAVAGLEIPPLIDEMVVKIGGAVPVADYGFPSSVELGQRACRALGEGNAALLRNHGAVGVGRSLQEALDVCELVERVAHTFVYASLLGKATPLPPDIVEAEQQIFRMQRKAGAQGNPSG